MRRAELDVDCCAEGYVLLLAEHALGDQCVAVGGDDGRVRRNLRRLLRLRIGGLVGFVVTEAPVADQVDDHVVPEALAKREREPSGGEHRLWVVGVDVDDRAVEALGEIGGVAASSGCPPGRL